MLQAEVAKGTHEWLHSFGGDLLALLDGVLYGVFDPTLELTDIIEINTLWINVYFLDLLLTVNLDADRTITLFTRNGHLLQFFLQLLYLHQHFGLVKAAHRYISLI